MSANILIGNSITFMIFFINLVHNLVNYCILQEAIMVLNTQLATILILHNARIACLLHNFAVISCSCFVSRCKERHFEQIGCLRSLHGMCHNMQCSK